MLQPIQIIAIIFLAGILGAITYIMHIDAKETDNFIKELKLQGKLKENKQSC